MPLQFNLQHPLLSIFSFTLLLNLSAMKSRIIFFILLFCSLFTLNAQDKASKVSAINAWVEKVRMTGGEPRIVLNNEEFMDHMTDGGGSLSAWFMGDSLCCIKEEIGLSYGILNTCFYLQHGKLVCVVEKESAFPYHEESGSLDYEHPALVYEGWFYFADQNLFETVKTGKRTFDDELFFDSQTKEGVLISSFEKYTRMLTKPK